MSDNGQAPISQVSTEENGLGVSAVEIYDSMARWWRIRRFQLMAALLLCIGIIVGMVILKLLPA